MVLVKPPEQVIVNVHGLFGSEGTPSNEKSQSAPRVESAGCPSIGVSPGFVNRALTMSAGATEPEEIKLGKTRPPSTGSENVMTREEPLLTRDLVLAMVELLG